MFAGFSNPHCFYDHNYVIILYSAEMANPSKTHLREGKTNVSPLVGYSNEANIVGHRAHCGEKLSLYKREKNEEKIEFL